MAASSSSHLHISDISVDFSKSGRDIKSAELWLRGVQRHVGTDLGSGKTLHETLVPPMKLSRGDTFSLRLLHKSQFLRRNKHKDINFDTEEVFRACDTREKHEYHKSHKGFAVVLNLNGNTSTEPAGQSASSSEESLELRPTTDKIFEICPRFRILVIGKTGVGKSSLINKAFGVDTVSSDGKRGEVDINIEFISEQNDKFVLHDSKGFEPSEGDNLEIVQQFIQKRRQKDALKDKLHAIWLCLEIARAGGRVLETGTEKFLKSKRDGELGDIPVVVVLTKYDTFIDHVERTLDYSPLKGWSEDAVDKHINQTVEAERDVFTRRVQEAAGSNIPYATVSNKDGHKEMIAHLIQVTEERVRQHVASVASVVAGVAQRVDPKLNIKTSIEVGKKKYWKALTSAAAFKGKTVQACLQVLHTDIIRVWNFHDPHRYLESKEFKASVVALVDKLDVGSIANPNRNMAVGLSTVGAIAGIKKKVSALSGPAAPIVVPIMASMVFAKWVYDTYQLSRVLLHHFIAYIVDLTLILQTLYLISESQELTPRAIKLAVKAYDDSTIRNDAHVQIQGDDWNLPLRDDEDRDTLDKIVQLMHKFSIEAGEISRLRALIPTVGSVPDEQW
ncbi:hypothetical protein K503DRAFT_801056 [Rhizopogon vinicolor AM-OR11-026]|uniref:G domain-containing protein n=1 Tax=Rhizopogon vinicolor AM-OR11-026 TaxID=1314800 RepID=A0A1B7MYH7_9AGAM|nr:hypothetical protein K503DRAFT_801056 [Rhizopogon vinicolor AM-OR11-026]